MIFYTLSDAASEIKSVIDGGACTMSVVYSRINQAMRRIMNRPRKPLHIRRLIRFYSYKDVITLPREVDRILHYTMDGVPAPLFSQAYEFVSGGPGELDGCDHCVAGKYLEDLGNQYSLMFDVPSRTYQDEPEEERFQPRYSGLSVLALSTALSDTNKSIYLIGRNEKNEPLGNSSAGAELKINQWDGGVEGNFTYAGEQYHAVDGVRDVTWVRKPATDGHVCLYTYDENTHQMYFLAKYLPYETNPKYRRYRITSPDYKYGSSIVAWCELGYVPQTHPDDVLIIQNIDALKLMVMALEMEDERDFQQAKAYEADAYRLITDQRNSERTHDYNLMQVSENYGFGDIQIR